MTITKNSSKATKSSKSTKTSVSAKSSSKKTAKNRGIPAVKVKAYDSSKKLVGTYASLTAAAEAMIAEGRSKSSNPNGIARHIGAASKTPDHRYGSDKFASKKAYGFTWKRA